MLQLLTNAGGASKKQFPSGGAAWCRHLAVPCQAAAECTCLQAPSGSLLSQQETCQQECLVYKWWDESSSAVRSCQAEAKSEAEANSWKKILSIVRLSVFMASLR